MALLHQLHVDAGRKEDVCPGQPFLLSRLTSHVSEAAPGPVSVQVASSLVRVSQGDCGAFGVGPALHPRGQPGGDRGLVLAVSWDWLEVRGPGVASVDRVSCLQRAAVWLS